MTAVAFRVARLEDVLPKWPPSTMGCSAPPSVPWREASEPVRPQRPLEPADFGPGWTPAGLETLRRILERTLRANGRRR